LEELVKMNKSRLPVQAALWKHPKNNEEDYILLKAILPAHERIAVRKREKAFPAPMIPKSRANSPTL
jgi:hypothetical protein